jgi:uncharacterized membrane protein YfbV (UPF0208 family)
MKNEHREQEAAIYAGLVMIFLAAGTVIWQEVFWLALMGLILLAGFFLVLMVIIHMILTSGDEGGKK